MAIRKKAGKTASRALPTLREQELAEIRSLSPEDLFGKIVSAARIPAILAAEPRLRILEAELTRRLTVRKAKIKKLIKRVKKVGRVKKLIRRVKKK